ncbi:hypothetical protein C8F04DRAFT_1186878 [Mycena alexandri]|uniref:Uncharacterized protein n=1 Tax=Mycena alexandri TaxID=1745969 RepID=A0AAD6SPM0_9AGAR|nr:hypothetical protein C8F04DRAFT_1186878 [Mycena alexandri]
MCFHRLPAGIADEIFCDALPTPDDPKRLDDVTAFLIRRQEFARVCRAWRLRLNSMHWIWAIVWTYRFLPASVVSFCVAQTNDRCFTLLVDAHFYNFVPVRRKPRTRVNCNTLSMFQQMLTSMLTPHFSRVWELHLSCESYEQWATLSMDLLALDGGKVERLDIAIAHCDSDKELFYPPNNWTAVRKVKTTTVPLGWGGKSLYRNVTTLSLLQPFGYYVRPSQLLDLLWAAPSLRVLEVVKMEFRRDDRSPARVAIPFLTYFNFSLKGHLECTSLLSNLDLPALCRLRLKVLWGDLGQDVVAACAFLASVAHLELEDDDTSRFFLKAYRTTFALRSCNNSRAQTIGDGTSRVRGDTDAAGDKVSHDTSIEMNSGDEFCAWKWYFTGLSANKTSGVGPRGKLIKGL